MNIKPKKILTEISAGELFDKISILEIKLEKIKDKESQKEINKEYTALKETQKLNIDITEKLQKLFNELKDVNLNLWKIEDQIRASERSKDFGKSFISFARNVYFNNDKRSKIKFEINKVLGSNIKEIKKYESY